MGKRSFSIVLALALFAGVISALPAGAQEAPATPTVMPPVVQIDDPAGDANTTSGDQVTPAGNVSNVGDLRKIWFSNTSDSLSVHIQTTIEPPAGSVGILYTVVASPGEGAVSAQAAGCLRFRVFIPAANAGGTYQGNWWTKLHDLCNEGTNWPDNGIEGQVFVETLEDGTGLTTLTFPRTYVSPLLADGAAITAPTGRTDALVGTDKVEHPATPARDKQHPWSGFRYDDTKVGTDYTITSGGGLVVEPAPEPTEEPPGKSDPPGKGKKKGCKKGKGKKKGACPGEPKPPVSPACPAYAPGEEGAEAETTVVTDAATEEKPVVVEFTAGAGFGNDLGIPGIAGQPSVYDETTSVFQNIQVDTANADSGLYAKLSFQAFHDYDLYLNYPDGSTAANSGDANVAPGHDLGGGSPDGAWVAGNDFESVTGIRTADCAGYTARMVSYLTNGGAMTLSLWLGEVVADPVAPGGGEQALSTFFSLLGI